MTFAELEAPQAARKIREPKDDRLLGVSAIKVYFSSWRRNAWYSVTAARYETERCLHLSLDKAKAFIERQRVQGSVFRIQELPALLCSGREHAMFITQVNTTVPLSDYSAKALPGGEADWVKKPRDNYLTFGATLGAVAQSFRHESRFWRITPSWNDGPLIRYVANSTVRLALTKERLCAWESLSFGRYYLLAWEKIQNPAKQSAVLSLSRKAGF